MVHSAVLLNQDLDSSHLDPALSLFLELAFYSWVVCVLGAKAILAVFSPVGSFAGSVAIKVKHRPG